MTEIKNILVEWLTHNCSCATKQDHQDSTYEISMYIERKQQFENVMKSITNKSPLAASKRSLRKKNTLNDLHQPIFKNKSSLKNIFYSEKDLPTFNQTFGITNVNQIYQPLPTSKNPSINVSSIQSINRQPTKIILNHPTNLHSYTSNHNYCPIPSNRSAFPENLKSFYIEQKSIQKSIQHQKTNQLTSHTSNPQTPKSTKKIDSLFKLKEIQSLVGQSQKNHIDISQVIYYTDHKKNGNNINICFTESRNESEFENRKNQIQVSDKQIQHNRSKSHFLNLIDKVSQQSL